MKEREYDIIIPNFFGDRWPYIFYAKTFSEVKNTIKKYDYVDQNQIQNLFISDFKTDKVILVLYGQGSGGNFFCNCLNLSTNTLTVENSIKSKILMLKEHVEKSTVYWKDCNIGLIYDLKMKENKKYFFITDHFNHKSDKLFPEIDPLEYHTRYWKNCKKVIIFKNNNLFSYLRRCVWKSNKTQIVVFDESDITLEQYFSFTKSQRNILKNKFKDKEERYSYCDLYDKKEIYFWDVDWFLDENDFIENMKMLYDFIELNGYNENAIKYYYKLWINKLTEIRNIEP